MHKRMFAVAIQTQSFFKIAHFMANLSQLFDNSNKITTGRKWTTINLERAKHDKGGFVTFLQFGIAVAFSVNGLVENY